MVQVNVNLVLQDSSKAMKVLLYALNVSVASTNPQKVTQSVSFAERDSIRPTRQGPVALAAVQGSFNLVVPLQQLV